MKQFAITDRKRLIGAVVIVDGRNGYPTQQVRMSRAESCQIDALDPYG
ncbi:MAG: hypothetical protein Q4C10_11960 [Clostridia bacterium]|nr:hypothetical protein [Clostridia bacterium]